MFKIVNERTRIAKWWPQEKLEKFAFKALQLYASDHNIVFRNKSFQEKARRRLLSNHNKKKKDQARRRIAHSSIKNKEKKQSRSKQLPAKRKRTSKKSYSKPKPAEQKKRGKRLSKLYSSSDNSSESSDDLNFVTLSKNLRKKTKVSYNEDSEDKEKEPSVTEDEVEDQEKDPSVANEDNEDQIEDQEKKPSATDVENQDKEPSVTDVEDQEKEPTLTNKKENQEDQEKNHPVTDNKTKDDSVIVEKISAHRRNAQRGMVYRLHFSDKTSLWSPEKLARIDCEELLDNYKKKNKIGIHKKIVLKEVNTTSAKTRKQTKIAPKLKSKCKVNHKHFDPLNLVAETMSSYFKENCRFYNSVCSSCRIKNLPTVSKPVYMCTNRTIGCSYSLCNQCYSSEINNMSGTRSRRTRGNTNKN